MTDVAARPGIRWGDTIARIVVILLLAFAIFGPLANLALWGFAERWYFPSKLPLEFGFSFCARVFSPRGGAICSLWTSVAIACLTVIMTLAVAVPAGVAAIRLPAHIVRA